VKTLRLLFWLRWRITMNTTSRRGRWAAAGITLLVALAMSPFYGGGALAAWAYVKHAGPPALLVVFGSCQFAILWVSLLTGAMGRVFELDKLRRYPMRPLDIFAINTLASMSEPVVLMTVPALVTGCIAVAGRAGAGAAALAGLGALALLGVSVSILQLLLALLDDLLRREWMRYLAAFCFTFTVIGFQLLVRRSSSEIAERARQAGVNPDQIAAQLAAIFAQVPTVAAPAALAGAHPAGIFGSPVVGFALCALIIGGCIVVGARVMATASRRASVGGVALGSPGAAGSFGARIPGFTSVQSLLLGREFLYLVRTPAVLYQMAVIPLTVIAITFLARRPDGPQFGAFLPLFVLVSSLAGRNLSLWGFDGPGMRTLFLLPLRSRDLVLTKNVAWLASALAEAVVVFGFLAFTRPAAARSDLPMYAIGYLAVMLGAAVIGTWISITRPTKPRQVGMARRSPGGVMGLVGFVAVLVLGGAILLAVLAVRSLTPARYDFAASLAVTCVMFAVAFVIWWISLERNADQLETHREIMIDVLSKSADA